MGVRGKPRETCGALGELVSLGFPRLIFVVLFLWSVPSACVLSLLLECSRPPTLKLGVGGREHGGSAR
jgi:hypothetical protein